MGSSAGWTSLTGIGNGWEGVKEWAGGPLGLAPGHNWLNDYMKGPPVPGMPDAPAGPAEDIDVAGQSEYTKARARQRKGRASTILGSNNKGKKTVLG